jgi:hypothetical protein
MAQNKPVWWPETTKSTPQAIGVTISHFCQITDHLLVFVDLGLDLLPIIFYRRFPGQSF